MRISETFGKLDRAFLILSILSLFSLSALAQSVKGIVKDQAGDAIIGATVKVEGTKTGAITDVDGQFTVKAGANSTLTVSYVGYTTKRVAVNGKNNIVIVLDEDNTTLNDLVVVGYGVQKKSDLTGSVASVKGDDIKNLSTTDAAAALQWRKRSMPTQSRRFNPPTFEVKNGLETA